MKKIVCELCEGTQFTKEGGFFVCHGCGTKYSLEEAKSMMQEVEGEPEPFVGGAPVVSAPVGNPNQAQIDNILVLATTAYEAQNYAEAENYCNRAIELDAMCYKAWNLKGKAVGWQSTIDNLRIEEAAHSFCKAIDFAPEDEKEELKNQATEELKKLGLALISLRKQRFSGNPVTEELNGFQNDQKVMLSSLLVLLSHGNAVEMPEGYPEEIATMMSDAAEAALRMAQNAWRSVDHPSDKDLTTYLDWNGNICILLRNAISVSDKDDEAVIKRYEVLNKALEDPIGKSSQTQQWNSYTSSYYWTSSRSLADSAVKNRRKEVNENKDKINAIRKKINAEKEAARKKAEEEKKARIKAYWEAHAEEKATLEAEKKQLTEKKLALISQITKIDNEINVIKAEEKAKVPSEEETETLKDQIKELEKRRANLGMFSGKEKKQIAEEIATLQGRIDSLKERIEEEKKVKAEDVKKRLDPLQSKKNELSTQRDAASKRITAIDSELIKDPGK